MDIKRTKRTKGGGYTLEERRALAKKMRAKYYKPPKYTQEEKELRARYREYDRIEREQMKLKKQNIRRELKVLKFMLKTDVKYYHHGRADSLIDTIKKQIHKLKDKEIYEEYDPYIWNYQGEGNNQMALCLMGRMWISFEFKSIYDVPLDGLYIFSIHDTGQRGLGAFNHITATQIEQGVKVPYVSSGSFPSITIK